MVISRSKENIPSTTPGVELSPEQKKYKKQIDQKLEETKLKSDKEIEKQGVIKWIRTKLGSRLGWFFGKFKGWERFNGFDKTFKTIVKGFWLNDVFKWIKSLREWWKEKVKRTYQMVWWTKQHEWERFQVPEALASSYSINVETWKWIEKEYKLKYNEAFLKKILAIASELQFNPNYLAAAMMVESGYQTDVRESRSRTKWNGGTGLIGFMPATAAQLLGVPWTEIKKIREATPGSRDKFRFESYARQVNGMNHLEQLDLIYKFLKKHKGKLRTIDDFYAAIFSPASIGKPAHAVIIDKEKKPETYRQNRFLDKNKDGKITKAEISYKVIDRYKRYKFFDTQELA